jgi:hypothetical protein
VLLSDETGTFLNQWGFSPAASLRLLGEEPMNTFRTRHKYHVASRVHRLDPRQESRRSLALIMLMGLAILSVTAATGSLSAQNAQTIHLYSGQ